MLVSGGKIIAIDRVNTDNKTLKGDGVFNELKVNTQEIAAVSALSSVSSTLVSSISSVSSKLDKTISSVSSTLVITMSSDYTDLSAAISAKQDPITFNYNEYNKISAINNSALAAGNNVIVSAGENVYVDTTPSGESTIYTISTTANPTDTVVKGDHGISAQKSGTEHTIFTVGLIDEYEQEIKKVKNKLDTSAFSSVSGTFLTAHQLIPSANWESTYNTVNTNSANWENVYSAYSATSGDWVTKEELTNVSSFIENQVENLSADVTSVSSKLDEKLDIDDFETYSAYIKKNYALSSWVDDNYQKKGNYLSADALTALSGKWESASNVVIENSANWNSVYNTVDEYSSIWNTVSVKLDVTAFTAWSAQTTDWDVTPYSAGEGLELKGHKFLISAKYLSANALDDLSGVWQDAAKTLSSNSASWSSVYDTVNTNSGEWQKVVESASLWNNVYDEYSVNSAIWNDTTNTVNTFSSKWNDVSSKANSTALEELSAKVKTISGELKETSSFLSGAIDTISSVFSAGIDYISGDVDNKLYTSAFTAWSANTLWDITPYSAGKGLALNNHLFYVSGEYVGSADSSFAGKMLVLKDNKWMEMPEFGGFTTATSSTGGYPDVSNPSTKLIYLIKDSTVTGKDQYTEWIYITATGADPEWDCIGDTSMKLLTAGNYIDITNNIISVTGLHNTTLSSNDQSVDITKKEDEYGNINYDLSVGEVKVPAISGYNGISARFNEDEYRYEIGFSANNYAYYFGHYKNDTTITDGDILKLDSNNYHNIIVDNEGYITLPETTNKFTFCINEYIDGNTTVNHEYLLNKLVLSAKGGNSIVASQNYYPSEVGSSNVTLALTIDNTTHIGETPKEYCIVYKGSDVPANKLNIEASILEEVMSLDSTNGGETEYIGKEPIRVVQHARQIELLYDENVFSLIDDDKLQAKVLTIEAAGGDVVDKNTFDKLLNTINGRMTETIPFGSLNQVASLAGKKQYAYLFRPTIEYEMTSNTVAYMFGGNPDSTERIAVAVYDSAKTSNNLIWRSDYPYINVGAGGEHTMVARYNSPSGTIYPDHLYYIALRLDKDDRGGGSWNNVLGVPIYTATDVGNLRCWLGYGLSDGENLDFPNSINFNTQGSLSNFGGLKPYVGFRTNIPNNS